MRSNENKYSTPSSGVFFFNSATTGRHADAGVCPGSLQINLRDNGAGNLFITESKKTTKTFPSGQSVNRVNKAVTNMNKRMQGLEGVSRDP